MGDSLINERVLAIDYGRKVSGLAIYAPGVDPYPLLHGTINYISDNALILSIAQVVSDESISVVVLGLPLLTDGQESDMTKLVRTFASNLHGELPPEVMIYLQDETLSSFEARERMKNSPAFNFKVDEEKVDSVAAAIILEDFLDTPADRGPYNGNN